MAHAVVRRSEDREGYDAESVKFTISSFINSSCHILVLGVAPNIAELMQMGMGQTSNDQMIE